LETADALITSRPERAQEAIRRALSLARGNLEEARRSVMDLRAAPLQNRTLPEALAVLAQHSCNDPTVEVDYSYSPAEGFPGLPARLEEGIYRIAQEALANACKHARAQHIDVTLTVEDQYLHFMVQDDGCGFDPDKVTGIGSEGHFGLIGMAERVKLLGGSICVSSEPGAGTCIAVRVSCN
jgi:two-component system NarL family sensor kinase